MSHSGIWLFWGHLCRNENHKSTDSLKVDDDWYINTAFVKFNQNWKSNNGLGVDDDCYVDTAIVKLIFVDRLYKHLLEKSATTMTINIQNTDGDQVQNIIPINNLTLILWLEAKWWWSMYIQWCIRKDIWFTGYNIFSYHFLGNTYIIFSLNKT